MSAPPATPSCPEQQQLHVLALRGVARVFVAGMSIDGLVDLSGQDNRVFIYAWTSPTCGGGSHVQFHAPDIADDPAGRPREPQNGEFNISLRVREHGEPDLLKVIACMRMKDETTKNRRDFTLASSATQLDRLVSGEEQAFIMYDQFTPGNYVEIRMSATNASSFANCQTPGSAQQGVARPLLTFKRSALWNIESDFKAPAAEVSNNMMSLVLQLGMKTTEGGEAFSSGLTSWEFGGAQFASGAPTIPPLTTHYSLMNSQETAIRRPFPLAIAVYHIYLRLLHSGMTPDEVVRMSDNDFGQFMGESFHLTRDAHIVSYQGDEAPVLSCDLTGRMCLRCKGTENMAMPCGAPQFLGRTVRELSPIQGLGNNKLTLPELFALTCGALQCSQGMTVQARPLVALADAPKQHVPVYTAVNRGILQDDCESEAWQGIMLQQAVENAWANGPPANVSDFLSGANDPHTVALRRSLRDWPMFSQWTDKCYGLMTQIVARASHMLRTKALRVTSSVGLATSAAAGDIQKHKKAEFNGHCFNIGCVETGDTPEQKRLKFFLLEGTAPTVSLRVTANTPQIPVRLWNPRTCSFGSSVVPFLEFCNLLGQCVNELTRVINSPHGMPGLGGGWPFTKGISVEGWVSSTMAMNALDSDRDSYLDFYNRIMYMGWQCKPDTTGCMPVETRLTANVFQGEDGGAGVITGKASIFTGCHPYDLNNTNLVAIDAWIPPEKRGVIDAIMDEAHPPLVDESVLRRLATFWAPCTPLVDVNAKERFLPREDGVAEYVRIACMETPAIPELVPVVCRAKHMAFRLADKINCERRDSDGIRFLSEDRPEGTGFHGFLRIPCKIMIPTACDSMRQALAQLQWPGYAPPPPATGAPASHELWTPGGLASFRAHGPAAY